MKHEEQPSDLEEEEGNEDMSAAKVEVVTSEVKPDVKKKSTDKILFVVGTYSIGKERIVKSQSLVHIEMDAPAADALPIVCFRHSEGC